MSVVFVLVGLCLLVWGGDLLVRGATRLAEKARVTPAIIGLTVVAAGTSMPELVVSVGAAWRGSTDIAVGNVVGSNIFNVAVVLGVAACVRPLTVGKTTLNVEWPLLLGGTFALHLLGLDGHVTRLEGAALFVALVAFVFLSVQLATKTMSPAVERELAEHLPHVPQGMGTWAATGLVLFGIAVLAGGAELLIRGAVVLARSLHVSEAVIGLTVVAAGTSLPELATSSVAAFKGENEVAVANVVGSNMFNILGILGATAVIRPLPISADTLGRDDLWMLGLVLALYPVLRWQKGLGRVTGSLLLVAFATYMTVLLRA